tara:strand:- start:3876 stop:5786 length:1911 start_codon:yes stop_codon:yes gene_type:complete
MPDEIINRQGYVFYPHTNNPVTHSFEERLTKIAEFDDALLDQAAWKNARYDGCKLSAKKINKFSYIDSGIDTVNTSSGEYEGKYTQIGGVEGRWAWGGDISYQNLPVVSRLSTAIYIANTVVGGEENDNYTTIKNHSYVNINQILLVNPVDNTVQVIDKSNYPYQDFHRFITTDFPAGSRCVTKIIEDQQESVPNNLQNFHRVRMNKGWLLKTFTFKHAGERSGSKGERLSRGDFDVYVENNTMYLWKGNDTDDDGIANTRFKDNKYITGSENSAAVFSAVSNQLRFRYANFAAFEGDSNGEGAQFNMNLMGPKFSSSSIHENKFVTQYYSGSYGVIGGFHSGSKEEILPGSASGVHTREAIRLSSFGKASKFIGVDTLGFLASNNADPNLQQHEKTEVHITFFQGTKDFAPHHHDERSISTFEVDQNRAGLDLEQGDICHGGVPTTHEFLLKGPNDGRFMPTTAFHRDEIQNAHMQNMSGSGGGIEGCTPIGTPVPGDKTLQSGITIDTLDRIHYFVQGGAYGEIGLKDFVTGSDEDHGEQTNLQAGRFNNDNAYSGSFHYEMSFLDKDHTLILNLDKNIELENGIGDKGLVIIPEHSHPQVAFNIDYYLQQSGIVNTGVESPQDIITDVNPNIE